jgi:outer membrane biosynthesis protein TonB
VGQLVTRAGGTGAAQAPSSDGLADTILGHLLADYHGRGGHGLALRWLNALFVSHCDVSVGQQGQQGQQEQEQQQAEDADMADDAGGAAAEQEEQQAQELQQEQQHEQHEQQADGRGAEQREAQPQQQDQQQGQQQEEKQPLEVAAEEPPRKKQRRQQGQQLPGPSPSQKQQQQQQQQQQRQLPGPSPSLSQQQQQQQQQQPSSAPADVGLEDVLVDDGELAAMQHRYQGGLAGSAGLRTCTSAHLKGALPPLAAACPAAPGLLLQQAVRRRTRC